TTALSGACGQMVVASLCAFIQFIIGWPAGAVAFGAPHLQIMGANAAAVVSWLSFMRLGQIGAYLLCASARVSVPVIFAPPALLPRLTLTAALSLCVCRPGILFCADHLPVVSAVHVPLLVLAACTVQASHSGCHASAVP